MSTSELALLLQHSDTTARSVIQETAAAAGLMWKCRWSLCAEYNIKATELCPHCGRDRDGHPLRDVQPGCWPVEDELWENLRTEVTAHLRQQGFDPLPDAVTFPWVSDEDAAPWSLTRLVLHYGGIQRDYKIHLERTEISDLLEQVAEAAEPSSYEYLRILPR
ncbi:hypothetical protein ACIG3E_32950 [Streptomyces sp. NPDC053474]|uniref:hypothetical protein n=1 Tax=Streptomyces sp. NPDC053474 TaxID=3365704 RepID=UPI0037D78701